FLFIADDITEHFICPAYLSGDRFRVRIQKQFRTVKAQPALWIVRTGHAKAIELPWPQIGQKLVPHLISLFTDWNTNVFFGRLEIIEQAKLNTGGVLGEESEVDTVAHPGCAQRIWVTEECSY